MLTYRLKIHSAEQHLYALELIWSCAQAGVQEVYMPSWTPGSYMIRDFSRNVVKITAEQNNQAIPVAKKDKDSWLVEADSGEIKLSYLVYARDASVRAAYLDGLRGFINPTAAFICPTGLERQPCEVNIEKPLQLPKWKLSTTMPIIETDNVGFGDYKADSFHDFIDYPLEFGEWRSLSFDVAGVQHEIVLSGITDTAFDEQRLIEDVQKICTVHIQRFHGDAQPPFEKYLFLLNVTKDGYGGLEHRDSTALVCSLRDLPPLVMPRATAEYRQLLGLFSHEYFHAWNVKRITPAVYQQPDYRTEVYTPLLWAFEGITSYFDDYTVLQAGCITVEEYLDTVSQTLSRVQRGSGRHLQSIAESSFDAWTRFYKQDANSPNAIVSYYAKGALVALALDLWLRAETQQAVTIEKLMQRLWQEHGVTGIGLQDDSISEILQALLAESGFGELAVALYKNLQSWVYGSADLPLDMLFTQVATSYSLRAPYAAGDKGGRAVHQALQVSLAAELGAMPQGLALKTVYAGGTAETLGLMDGDILIAINNIKADIAWLQALQANLVAGEQLQVHYFRDGVLHTANGSWQAAVADRAVLQLQSEASDGALAIRKAWLGE